MSTKRMVSPPERREMFWIDVRDHMPDDETTVLVASDSDVTTGYHANELWWDCCSDANNIDVTHWMDLPELPNRPPDS